ncbi:UvrD-helicase domain-containing protein [Ramlibacter sp. MAHUQ-53]|uniref:UvrD-helicase domain-containing protein n=1 Tax=unclassified Ramlibacter TaxID=2617605 RepID=UPI0036334099
MMSPRSPTSSGSPPPEGTPAPRGGPAAPGAPSGSFAYEVNGHRVPREAFYAIACDPRRSVAVEACAGAGKTWMLVSRILRALLAGTPPHEILAITFTKKAAGEMRERLHEWLEEFAHADDAKLLGELAARGVPPGEAPALVAPLRGLYAQLLAAGRPVQVRTFHSWFAALLRTAPLATLEHLGLPARHDLLEDDAQAVAKVWRRFHDRVAGDADARRDYESSVAAHGRSQTLKALLGALSKRTEFGLADAEGVVEASVKPWDEVFPDLPGAPTPAGLLAAEGPVRAQLLAAARALGQATQATFSAAGSQLEQGVSAGDLAQALGGLLTQKNEPRKFNDKLAGIGDIRAAQYLALRLLAAQGQHEAWLHHLRMARLARILIEEYAQLKRDEGWVDMNDVERAALVMLSDPVLSGWVQERLDARIAHLLVDEFQDTNPLQWQALHAWLSGYAGAGGGDAPGVFIVGDPKQSIYRFRRAEPQVFRAAQRFVVDGLGGDLLGCDHTRRNAPSVLGAMNQVMEAAQAAGQYEGFRAHTTESAAPGRVLHLPAIAREPSAAPAAGEAPAPAEGWRDSLTTPRELPEERLLVQECRQAARWLARRIAGGLAPQDIMVLARRRDRLVAMQDELRDLGIPSQQPEKADLGEAPEVQDLVALVDVLVTPTHDLSMARVLKSPVFSVPDAALVELALRARAVAAEGHPRPWLDLLQDDAWTPPAPLAGVGEVLAKWKRWIDRLPPHDALDAIVHDGDVLARYAQAAPPALRESVLANLRALLGAALEVSGGRYATPYAFVRALRAGGLRAPAVAQAGAVRLLTVHGAKGLEAPLVLLLDTDAPAPRAETMGVLVDWPGEAAAPRRFAFLASESKPPACCVAALEAEKQARQREELNALYVAMTRARGELAASSVEPRTPAEGSWWRRVQPLCEPVAEADVAPVSAAHADAGAPCGLPVVPAPSTPLARPVKDDEALVPADGLSRFGQALHRLLECWPDQAPACPPPLLQRVAREFGLSATVLQDAQAMAARIRRGEGAWAWDPQAVDWAGNEVEIHHEGELLRLDRLVRRRQGGDWWVLDYKSAARPEQDDDLLEQLRRYRRAVAAAHPGEAVRAAFLTGLGRLVPVE